MQSFAAQLLFLLSLSAPSQMQGSGTPGPSAKPGKRNFVSAGNGTPHLCRELLKLTSRAELTHVPFNSGAEAVNAVAAGQIDVGCDAITGIKRQAVAGRMRMVVLASDKRNLEIPDVPAAKEQGTESFQVGSWNALLGPSGMANREG